jgi:lipoprotein
MIQRIQTIYICIAVVLGILSLILPIAYLVNTGMGLGYTLFNFWLKDNANGTFSFTVIPLFILQVITIPIGLYCIFKYNNRPFQARLCLLNIVLLVLWYAFLGYFVWAMKPNDEQFQPLLAVSFPLIEIILYFMARKAIWKDEKLVRSANRIR